MEIKAEVIYRLHHPFITLSAYYLGQLYSKIGFTVEASEWQTYLTQEVSQGTQHTHSYKFNDFHMWDPLGFLEFKVIHGASVSSFIVPGSDRIRILDVIKKAVIPYDKPVIRVLVKKEGSQVIGSAMDRLIAFDHVSSPDVTYDWYITIGDNIKINVKDKEIECGDSMETITKIIMLCELNMD
jgi:hypothetical protein